MHRMNPVPGSPHFALLQEALLVKRYRLFPAHLNGSQIKNLDLTRYIEKRELNFLNIADLKPHDLEYAALTEA